MFERSFLESSFNATGNRRWATLLSMGLQAILVAILILLPLLFTEALPRLATYTELLPPPPAAPRGNGGGPGTVKPARAEVRAAVIHEPRAIPATIAAGGAESVPVAAWGMGGPGTGGTGGGNGNGIGVPGGVEDSLGAVPNVAWMAKPPVLPTTAPVPPKRLAVSQGVAEGMLVHRVVPVYPELARRARISGAVTLRAVIGKEGMIENLRLASGHPLLAGAALDAVRQWRYRPYLLNREPVEVDTEITVNFNLAQ